MTVLSKNSFLRHFFVAGQILGGVLLSSLFSVSAAKAECSNEQLYEYQTMGLSNAEIWKLCDFDPGHGSEDKFRAENRCADIVGSIECQIEAEMLRNQAKMAEECREGDWRACDGIINTCSMNLPMLSDESFCDKYLPWAAQRSAAIKARL